MHRILLLGMVAAFACKKPKPAATEEPSGPPKIGHSVTKTHGDEPATPPDNTASHPPDATVVEPPDAKPGSVVGGNGAPAYRDDQGKVHGPGGPVFMGRGVDCDDIHDHCLRPEVWFSIGDITPGKLYRAVPVFTYDNKWWTWRGNVDEDAAKLYRTAVVGKNPLRAGTPIVFFSSETSSKKWLDTEYEALTTSRWAAGVTESASAGGSVRVKGWGDVPMDTVRVILETRAR